MGIGFAIPINMVREIKGQPTAHGKADRGYLGVGVQELSQMLLDVFKLESPECIL